MNISAIPSAKIDPSHIAVENLAHNSALTEEQKIGEASKQFEAILLRQFLTEAVVIQQKIKSSEKVVFEETQIIVPALEVKNDSLVQTVDTVKIK